PPGRACSALQHTPRPARPPPILTLDALRSFRVGHNLLTGPVPPAAPGLVDDGASLCSNPLDIIAQPGIDPAWDKATGGWTPWWENPQPGNRCDELFGAGVEY